MKIVLNIVVALLIIVEYTTSEKCFECSYRYAIGCLPATPDCGVPIKTVDHFEKFDTIESALKFLNRENYPQITIIEGTTAPKAYVGYSDGSLTIPITNDRVIANQPHELETPKEEHRNLPKDAFVVGVFYSTPIPLTQTKAGETEVEEMRAVKVKKDDMKWVQEKSKP